MPSGVKKPATAAQIAENGHIAARIRAYLGERGMGAEAFAKQVGMSGNGGVYKWLNAKAAPGPKMRRKVATLLGCTPDELLPREPGRKEPMVVSGTTLPLSVRKAISKVLEFDVTSDGEAHIKLDISMPVDKAMPFLRLLMDVGVLVGKMNLEEVSR